MIHAPHPLRGSFIPVRLDQSRAMWVTDLSGVEVALRVYIHALIGLSLGTRSVQISIPLKSAY